MSRKKTQPKKIPLIDPIYKSTIIPKLINSIMYDGKKTIAEKIVYDALEKIMQKKEEIEKINYASGTCLFTSKQVFDKVGLLDAFIFLYHDDLDLGWRALQIGINSYYVPKSRIFHVESYSLKWSEEKFYWLERNRKYCLHTHFSKNTYEKMKFSLFYQNFGMI